MGILPDQNSNKISLDSMAFAIHITTQSMDVLNKKLMQKKALKIYLLPAKKKEI